MQHIFVELLIILLLGALAFGAAYSARRWIWPNEALHPSFAGSLLTVSGALFAGSVAWVISDINLSFQRAIEVKRDRSTKELAIRQLEEISVHVDGIISRFPEAAQQTFAARLLATSFPPMPPTTALPATPVVNNIVRSLHELEHLKDRLPRQKKAADLAVGDAVTVLTGYQIELQSVIAQYRADLSKL